MNMLEKDIIKFDFSYPQNEDNFSIILEKELKYFNKNLKKKILICATELIQNNFIHNDFKNISLYIAENNTCCILTALQIVQNEQYLKILQKIEEINKKTIEELKEIYKNNLQKDCSENVGNGLIICKIKSNNNIEAAKMKNYFIIKLSFNNEKN